MWELGASGGERSFGLRTASRPETLTKPNQRNWLIGKEGTLRARTVLGPWLDRVSTVVTLSRVRNGQRGRGD